MSISVDEEKVLDKIQQPSQWKHSTSRNRKKLPLPDNFTLNEERLYAFPRERCLVSPLVFNVVLKFLARAIRKEYEIKGIQTGKK